jgi:hypothetical protein
MPPDRPHEITPRKQSVQQWIRENYGDKDFAAASEQAKKLYAENLRRHKEWLARTHRPARVS